jgi:glycerophosphoryl diester phosphodiesterase
MLILPPETLIFGHRGASGGAPQNTLPAFQLALEHGAAGVELDVHLTSDNQLVIIHDFTVDHTTDGTGAVAEMTLEQIKVLDAGKWFGEAYAMTQVPTLQEVFELLDGRLLINVEIKAATEGLEFAVAAAIRQYNMVDKVIVSSFDAAILQRFQRVMPEVAIGWLYVAAEGFDTGEMLGDLKVNAVHPHHEMINSAYMDWAREQDYVVNTWTVNDPQQALALRELGVNVIITDYPKLLIDTLAATKNDTP